MNVVVLGATGKVGRRIVDELLRRGHRVTGVARGGGDIDTPGVNGVSIDASDLGALTGAIAGHDAVISAMHFHGSSMRCLLPAVRRTGTGRLLVVGGAGSLFVAPGVRLLDTPNFPASYRDEALAGAAVLDELRSVTDIEWTFLSPSIVFGPGERTGVFRLGDDSLLTGAGGKSAISYEDFAVGLVDELEQPAHSGHRFTIGY